MAKRPSFEGLLTVVSYLFGTLLLAKRPCLAFHLTVFCHCVDVNQACKRLFFAVRISVLISFRETSKLSKCNMKRLCSFHSVCCFLHVDAVLGMSHGKATYSLLAFGFMAFSYYFFV